jgi:hypothetical protein
MDFFNKLIGDIETHDVNGITECFEHGVNPNALFRGEPLIYELTSEYARGPEFKECVRAFLDHGPIFEDRILLAVLLDDFVSLDSQLNKEPSLVNNKYTLRCAYTPLLEASLLHICAEFNHVDCARVLVKYGADVNAKAGKDEWGFGGQTPIFHTVNQNSNHSLGMLNYLLSLDVDLKYTVPGLIWGRGYEWETLIPSVNPISYAMMGLLPQMHRNEKTISEMVSRLLRSAYGIEYTSPNLPNAYLRRG